EPGERPKRINTGRDAERNRPRMPLLDRDTHNERGDQTTDVADGVHRARDDPGVLNPDVETDRPAGAEREVDRPERERQQRRLDDRLRRGDRSEHERRRSEESAEPEPAP